MAKLVELDTRFHDFIFTKADNERLQQIIGSLVEQVSRFRVTYLRKMCIRDRIISQKIATTPIDQIVRVKDLLRLTFSGEKGVGGYETRGKGRRGYPKGGDAMSRPRQMEMALARKRPGIGH